MCRTTVEWELNEMAQNKYGSTDWLCMSPYIYCTRHFQLKLLDEDRSHYDVLRSKSSYSTGHKAVSKGNPSPCKDIANFLFKMVQCCLRWTMRVCCGHSDDPG
jgi:hypothetical protein